MIKIGIIGSPNRFESTKVKNIIFKIKNTYGPAAEIVSGGNKSGVEREVRKYALELEMPYKEYNPAYTPYSGFSALREDYYNRPPHPTHDIGRYRRLIDYCDAIVIFPLNDQAISSAISYGEKKKKKIIKI